MHLFAVTGGIASGKSTVSAALADLGCPIIDADLIARQVVEPGKPAWKLIIGHFGVDVLLQDGHIDRPKLGRIVFEDAGKRHLLNICTHPYIQKAMLWEAVKFFLKGEPFIVIVSPLLFESGTFLKLMKKIVVVNCTHEQQVERLMARDGITDGEALQRIQAQMPLAEKCRRADVVIDNSSDRDHTLQQVWKLHEEMKKLASFQWIYRIVLAIVLVVGIMLVIKLVL